MSYLRSKNIHLRYKSIQEPDMESIGRSSFRDWSQNLLCAWRAFHTVMHRCRHLLPRVAGNHRCTTWVQAVHCSHSRAHLVRHGGAEETTRTRTRPIFKKASIHEIAFPAPVTPALFYWYLSLAPPCLPTSPVNAPSASLHRCLWCRRCAVRQCHTPWN